MADEPDEIEALDGVDAPRPDPGARYRRRPDPAGPLPRLDHRRPRLRLGACPPTRLLTRTTGDDAKPDTAGQEQVAADPDRNAWSLRDRGQGDRPRHRSPHHALRDPPGARHQGLEGLPAQGRSRLRAGRDRHQDPGADPRQAGRRRRGSQRATPDCPARRRLPGAAGRLVAADGLAGQGHRRPGDRRRPDKDAAPAGRRDHRRRQVSLRQRDALQHPAASHAARRPAGAGRPQAGRAQPLRRDPAPADPGHHEPPDGGQRPAEPRQGDGAALLDHVAVANA